MPVKETLAKHRKGLTNLAPGVWVRQNAAGENFCKVMHCQDPPESLKAFHRGMCGKHFRTRADGRARCTKCRVRYAVDPMTDQLCEFCHPQFQETTPFETQVLEEIRKGAPPITAVQAAMGDGTTRLEASRKLERMSKSQKMARRMKHAMKRNGIDDDVIFKKLRSNLDATKKVYNGEGDLVDEVPDVRASNQTAEILLKVMGAFPSRVQAKEKTEQNFNVAVAVLPQEEPRKPDAKIYTLPPSRLALRSGGGDE